MDSTITIIFLMLMFHIGMVKTSAKIGVNDADNDGGETESKSSSTSSCSMQRKIQMDRLVNKILAFGEGGRTFPENEQQLKPFCNETNTMIKSVEDYFKQCERRDTQDMANIFIYSIKHVTRVFCRKRISKKVQQFFLVAPCLNQYIEHDVCISGFAMDTKPLIVAAVGNDKLKHICCNYIRAMNCVDAWVMNHKCSREYRELLNDYVHGIFDNMINFMCGETTEDSDRCDRLKPLQPLDKKQLKNLKPYESFMFIVMEVLESLQKSSGSKID